jgi:hypothetical protein
MKKHKPQQDVESDTLRPEYDLSRLVQVGERGKYHKALRQGYTRVVQHKDGTEEITHFRPLPETVHLDPDVRAYFPDSESVSAARAHCSYSELSGGRCGSRRKKRLPVLEPHDVYTLITSCTLCYPEP